MSGESSINFDGVWKRFRKGQFHDSLRDLLPHLGRRLLGSAGSGSPRSLDSKQFWAVRDLSFEVGPGQALGIIGANGAGKSTTLKILTRILRPTIGTSRATGRIGALIEVSAGFHYDLTGSENIFLQGSIMGMPLRLIRERFSEIVEFAGVGEFLDTPVKRYSSGMQARLGFAVAAHLDPDVLIIDEVLAVGDLRFQDRAFSRIKEMVTSGIPVVIVSHQLDRIASLCTDALVLDRGAVAHRGTPADCITWYLSDARSASGTSPSSHVIHVHTLRVDGSREVASGDAVRILLHGETLAEDSGATIIFRVRSAETARVVFGTDTHRNDVHFTEPGPFDLTMDLEMNLAPGVYSIEPYVCDGPGANEDPAGPIAYIQVLDEPGFMGHAQLKPRMRLDRAATVSDSPEDLARPA